MCHRNLLLLMIFHFIIYTLLDCTYEYHIPYAGSLLSRFVEKNLRYTLVSNPMRNSITWRTKRLRLGDCQEIDQSEDDELLGSQGELNPQVAFQ